jgi:hypothetical protein
MKTARALVSIVVVVCVARGQAQDITEVPRGWFSTGGAAVKLTELAVVEFRSARVPFGEYGFVRLLSHLGPPRVEEAMEFVIRGAANANQLRQIVRAQAGPWLQVTDCTVPGEVYYNMQMIKVFTLYDAADGTAAHGIALNADVKACVTASAAETRRLLRFLERR